MAQNLSPADGMQVLKFAYDNEGRIRVLIDEASIIRIDGVSTPLIYNVDVELANTEYYYLIFNSISKINIKSRLGSKLQISFIFAESAIEYITIPVGCDYTIENLNRSNNLLIYFQGNQADDVLEIQRWE